MRLIAAVYRRIRCDVVAAQRAVSAGGVQITKRLHPIKDTASGWVFRNLLEGRGAVWEMCSDSDQLWHSTIDRETDGEQRLNDREVPSALY